ncbi:MAG TPA: hypothetical protein VJR89_05265 [Polyangiales bacterium]|nr:hypothetical protein [Polyangiales bacterium]
MIYSALVVFAFAATVVVFVAPFNYAKFEAIAHLRRRLPVTADGSAGSAANTTILVAFDRKPSADNFFFASGRDVYEQRGRHRLIVRFSEAEPQWHLVSYVTSIMYLNQRMNTLSFHPFAARTSYRQSLHDLEQLLQKLSLFDDVDWTEYQSRLDQPIETHEVYVPRIVLPSATVQPYMNCNWNFDALPREQLDRVECYPILYVTPTEPAAE